MKDAAAAWMAQVAKGPRARAGPSTSVAAPAGKPETLGPMMPSKDCSIALGVKYVIMTMKQCEIMDYCLMVLGYNILFILDGHLVYGTAVEGEA